MADAMKTQAAMNVMNTICEMYDDQNFRYDRHDEDLVITCSIHGDDIPMQFIIQVDAEREVVRFLSPMPFKAPEDKRIDMAIAVAVANYGLINGSFDYDMSDGEIRFRMTASYIDSTLGKELFQYMTYASANTVDRYNDRFMMLNKGIITIEQFLEMENSEN